MNNVTEQAREWIIRSTKDNAEIAKLLGCDPELVEATRAQINELAYNMSQGKGKDRMVASGPPSRVKDRMVSGTPRGKERTPPEAGSIDETLDERGSRYGSFVSHAHITQKLKLVMQDTPNWHKLDDDQCEALEMVAHKIGRILNGDPNYADSWVDIAGYAKLVADRLEGKVR